MHQTKIKKNWCTSRGPHVLKLANATTNPCLMWLGGIFALRAHCALLLDYVPPKSPQANSLETPLELGDPNCPSSRKLQTTFPSHNTHHAQLENP